jgi:hypothetical protein
MCPLSQVWLYLATWFTGLWFHHWFKKSFEDTKGITRRCKSKDRQFNGQKEKGQYDGHPLITAMLTSPWCISLLDNSLYNRHCLTRAAGMVFSYKSSLKPPYNGQFIIILFLSLNFTHKSRERRKYLTIIEHIFYFIIPFSCQNLSSIHAFVLHTNGLNVDADNIPELGGF